MAHRRFGRERDSTTVAAGTWEGDAYVSGESTSVTMGDATGISVVCPYTGKVTLALQTETTSGASAAQWTSAFSATFISQG